MMEVSCVIKTILFLYLCQVIIAEVVEHNPQKPVKNVKKMEIPKHLPKNTVNEHIEQKKLKVDEDKHVEGAGDGPIEDAKKDEGDIEETDITEDDDDDTETDDVEDDDDEEEDDDVDDDDEDDDDDDEDDDDEEDDEDEDEDEEKREEKKEKEDFIEPHEEMKPPEVKVAEGKGRKVPSLVMINKHTFLENMKHRKRFIVNIGNLGCKECQNFYEEYRLVLHYFHDTKQKIDTILLSEKQVLDDFGFEKDEYPAILYYRHGVPLLYDGPLAATGVQSWVENNSAVAATQLTDSNFDEKVVVTDVKSTQWLVFFYDPNDPICWRPLALTETLATKLHNVNIGLVDITKNKVLAGKLKDQNNIPSWFLFRKDDTIQLQFYERLTLRHIEDTYKEASLTLQEKLGRAAVQVKGFLLYTGGAVTVALFVFLFLCKKVAHVGHRRIKKGV